MFKKKSLSAPRIAVLISTSAKSNRDKLTGVFRYVQEHSPWNIQIIEQIQDSRTLTKVLNWPADGLIVGRMPNGIDRKINLRLPTIVMDGPLDCYRNSLRRAAFITCDTRLIAESAAHYLVEAGFRHFAYVHNIGATSWSQERYRFFSEDIAKAGLAVEAVFPTLVATDCGRSNWNQDQENLIRWLKNLPPKTAIFVAHDIRARQVLGLCVIANIQVPANLAVLSVDNDEVLCESLTPGLASIEPDFQACGYLAAQLLDRFLLKDKSVKPGIVLHYGIRQLVERASCMFIEEKLDTRLQKALTYIHQMRGEPISPGDVARKMCLSQRMAELLFRKQLKQSITLTLQHSRIDHLKKLLLNTHLPIEEICQHSIYQSESHAKRLFKKFCGRSMSQYRSLFSRKGNLER